MGSICFKTGCNAKASDAKAVPASEEDLDQLKEVCATAAVPGSASKPGSVSSTAPAGENLQQEIQVTPPTGAQPVGRQEEPRGSPVMQQTNDGQTAVDSSLPTAAANPAPQIVTQDGTGTPTQIPMAATEHNSGGPATESPRSRARKEGRRDPGKYSSGGSLGSAGTLDDEAAAVLRKYAERNKPSRDKFLSGPGKLVRQMSPQVDAQDAAGPPGQVPGRPPSETSGSTIEERMIGVLVKYDIFDDIDADRLKEFDEIFAKVKQSSNYEAHKGKQKKDRSKFSTAAGVTTDDETGELKVT